MRVVSNTTPIISLAKIRKLDLLKELFNEVFISQGVYEELCVKSDFAEEIDYIKSCSFIKTKQVTNEFAVELLRKHLGLDLGESESITLAQEISSDVLIMDEAKGRKIAQSLDIEITGTAGILVSSKIKGLIPEVKPLLDNLIKNKIRISEKLYSEVLKKAEE